MRRAASAATGLMPVSALLVWATNDSPMGVVGWLAAVAVAEVILCVFMGCVAMIIGFLISGIYKENRVGSALIRFGAALGAGVFGVFTLWNFFSRPK